MEKIRGDCLLGAWKHFKSTAWSQRISSFLYLFIFPIQAEKSSYVRLIFILFLVQCKSLCRLNSKELSNYFSPIQFNAATNFFFPASISSFAHIFFIDEIS